MKRVPLAMLGLSLVMGMVLAPPARAGRPTDVPPIAPPYDPQRALAQSDFLRLNWHDAQRNRDVPVKIYFPRSIDDAGPFPVIVFSHGLGGTREGYEYLARQWAANGYVCLHLQHPGSDDSAWRGKRAPMDSMRRAASYQNSIDRAGDVHFAIDQLESLNRDDARFKGKLDLDHIGMAGHSFGAQTTLLVSGQQFGLDKSLKDPRVKAALPMSAPVPAARGRLDEIYRDISIPVFIMTGTKDDSPLNDTKAADRRLPFDHIRSSPTDLLTLAGGDHMVFSGRLIERPGDAEMQKLIRLASTAFFDAWLKGSDAAGKWLSDGGFAAQLGEMGVFEQK